MPRTSSFAPVLLLALLCAAGLTAQTHPNFARGYEPGKAFQVGDLDSVNLFNGALTVSIPLGPTFPVGGSFSYGLTLTHASNAWEFQEHCANGDPNTCTAQVVPLRHFNAGHGWKVSLGEIVFATAVRPASYRGPDGAEHRFYDRLHKGDPLQAGVWYTRDGTYLRYTAGTRKLELPDGALHLFDTQGRVVRMEDRFGNGVTVTYGNSWVLTDSVGRRHEIYFKAGIAPDFPLVIDRVELQAFGTQANGQPNRAVYTFEYREQPVTLRRPAPHNDGPLGTHVTVPMLSALALPEGLRYEMTGYHTDWSVNSRAPGSLQGLRLPTLGRLEWDYTLYQFPTGSALPEPSEIKRRILTNALGVAKRRVIDPIGGTTGTWVYSQSVDVPPGGTEQPVEMTTTVNDPLGHRTVHYFSAFYEGATSWPAIGPDYGRPYTLRQNDGATPPRYLSTQVYHADGRLLRATWLRHARDEITAGESLRPYQELNSRVSGSRTVYHDDGSRFADTDSSDFDGLGRYRTTTTGGNFGAGDVRISTTDYDPDGTYKIDSATGLRAADSSFSMPAPSAPWVLGTFGETKVTEGAFTERSLTCFNLATGFLERRRRLRQPGNGARGNDLLTAYGHINGNVTVEKLYGGDGASLATADPCGFTLPTPSFQLDHTWSAGVRASSQWAGVDHQDLDLTLDPVGLPSASRDTSELETGLEHDWLGRRTWDKPAAGHGGWTEYVYTPADPDTTSPAKVLIRRRANGSKTANVLAQSEILFDGLGRVWRERDLLPSGSWSTRETRYDGAGNRAWVSERQAGDPDKATRFLHFDPFGRPGAIRPADRSDSDVSHDVTLTYTGVREVSRKVRVGTARNDTTGAITETVATTTELYDRQGRLWKITEPSGAGDGNVTTTYTYDAGNRLRTVKTTALVDGVEVAQDRAFDYDALGLLRAETHPEKGAAGNGAVTYSSYDARGLAGRKADGASDLTFHFDAAGRLEEVKEATGTKRLLKKWIYGTSNADNSNGRVIGSERYHYVPQGTVLITTEDQRLGRDGRVSRRDLKMKFNGTQAESFRQAFSWNPLGDLAFADYPVCNPSEKCPSRPAVFTDVEATHWAKPEIEAIHRAGVTAGCSVMPPKFCPGSNHSRAQMAVFLLVAKEGPGYQPPPCTAQLFNDVPCSDPLARWINELVARGITAGCGGGNFCPNGTVSHGQMAVFLLRTWETGYTAPPATCTPEPLFSDVPCNDPFAPWIEEIARRGIWSGSSSCASGRYCPGDKVTRDQMAVLLARTFGIPIEVRPALRTVTNGYENGYLNSVTGYGALSYHLNGMVSEVRHGNRVTDTQTNDPNSMRRPAALSAAFGSTVRWSSGDYAYDGAGNITKIGDNTWYLYDKVSRLKQGNVALGALGGGAQRNQTYTFDPFGNLTAISGHSGRNIPSNPDTNRLNGTGTVYDAAGNLTAWNGATYEYDPFHQMSRMTSGTEDWRYAYTADGERVWMYNPAANTSRWTLRDLDGKVLREYLNQGGIWSVDRDYIYRDGLLLAAETPQGPQHFHLDHLGTPRLVTDRAGRQVAYHAYYPFGEEATAFAQDGERMKFTGHERDLADPAGAGDDLDYMHARHCSPVTGRFLSVDPSLSSVRYSNPQTWNRYSYTYNNPLNLVDPDGQIPVVPILLAIAGGLLFGSEAANAPESQDSPGIPNSGGLRPIGAAALFAGFGAGLGGGGISSQLNAAFRLPPVARGNLIEKILATTAGGGALPRTFPVIDRFANGVATSVKSLDLRAPTYQSIARLTSTLTGYVDRLASFQGAQLGKVAVSGDRITQRVLELVIQHSALTPEQAKAIADVARNAQNSGVTLRIIAVR